MTIFRILILTAIGIACATSVAAQAPGGGDPLEQICSGFLQQNSLQISGDAQRLCSCLVREVKGKLSRAEMEAYDKVNAQGLPMPPALQNKITGIAVQCLTEAK